MRLETSQGDILRLNVLVNKERVLEYVQGKAYYVESLPPIPYTLEFNSSARVLVSIVVDGLSATTGESIETDTFRYMVDSTKPLFVNGWGTGASELKPFTFRGLHSPEDINNSNVNPELIGTILCAVSSAKQKDAGKDNGCQILDLTNKDDAQTISLFEDISHLMVIRPVPLDILELSF